jgi:TusA-related sulfurtransferase
MDIRLTPTNSSLIAINDPAETVLRTIDITSETCPMTYVRVRLALDSMKSGEILLVLLTGDDPRQNVPKMATSQGHALLSETADESGITRLMLRKG